MAQRRRLLLALGSAAAVAVSIALVAAVDQQPGYDAAYALAWGQDVVDGHGLVVSHLSAPTPHPLTLAGTITLGLLPVPIAVTISGVWSVLAGIVLVALLAGVSWKLTASRAATAAVAGATSLSAPVVLLVLGHGIDVTYAALGAAGVLLILRGRHVASIAVLGCAALLRPEALVLLAIPLTLAIRTRQDDDARAARWAGWATVTCVVTAVIAWLAMGSAAGDPLIALHSAADNAALNDNPRGLGTALRTAIPNLAEPLGWPVAALACLGVVLALLPRTRRSAASIGGGGADRAHGALVVVSFVALSVAAYIAQGLLGTPLVARYLLFPALLLGPLAARGAVGVGSPVAGVRARSVLVGSASVAVAVAALVANWAPLGEVREVRAMRQTVFDAADELLGSDLAQDCPGALVVRSPAMVPQVALTLERPLGTLAVAEQAGTGVLLQPLTLDAAELGGYGPMTPLQAQAVFPDDASPRAANEHWALYSNCTPETS